ncbi:MAG: flavin-containing monooxygenase [Saprospiraceae bacterium]
MQIANQHLDVLIVGAGLSGIGAAYHLQTKCPDRSFALLEMRENMGGTWDLFRYPGIRSDSDMYTLGYNFRPWKAAKAIADGPAILEYIKDTASENQIDKKIAYQHKMIAANWSSADKKWTVKIAQLATGKEVEVSCQFLLMCSGYYDYDQGYTPDFQGIESFNGQLVHPQKWTSDIDYDNKKVVVIGSGATAVTLVPELAKKAAKVTMLQRSPTYIITTPSEDVIANFAKKILPAKVAYKSARWKNITLSILIYQLARRFPNFIKRLLMKLAQKELPAEVDVNVHFNPKYKPWDQRLCLIPDSDLYESLSDGSAQIVTDHIQHFTETGIQLKSGKHLEADLVVSATGLKMLMLGGATISIDNQTIKPADLFCYRGMMFNGMPNFAMTFGYTNASWTLKADLTCDYVCRILNYFKKTGATVATPIMKEELDTEPLLDFNSGYVLRDIDNLPKQGSKKPWKVHQNYVMDLISMKYNRLEDGVMEFGEKK